MRKSTKQLAVGTVLAAAIGYAAGILTAPKSGKETRQDISDAAKKAKSEAEKKLKELYADLDIVIAKANEALKTASARTKSKLNDAITKARVSKDKTKQVLNAVREGSAEDADLDQAVTDAATAVSHLKSFLNK